MNHILEGKEIMSLRRVAVSIVKKIFSYAKEEEELLSKVKKGQKDDYIKDKLERIIQDIKKEEKNLRRVHQILDLLQENLIHQMHKVKDRAKESHSLGGVQHHIDKEIGLFSSFLRHEYLNLNRERKEIRELEKAA